MNKYIVFICHRNRFRSVIAEAFFNRYSKKHKAVSAGMAKADSINPAAIELMKEKNIDVSAKKPQLYTFDMLKNATKVVTFGCEGGVCLPFPSEEWRIPDVKGMAMEQMRAVRDEIEKKVKKLVKELEG